MTEKTLPQLEGLNGQPIPAKLKPTTISEINIAGRDSNYLDDDQYGETQPPVQDPQDPDPNPPQPPQEQQPTQPGGEQQTAAALPDPTENTTDRYLIGCLVNVKYHPKSTGTYSIRQKIGASGTSKYLKSSTTYRRMFFWADMLSNGDVFATFEQNNADTNTMFRNGRKENLKIGDFVLFLEPDPVEHIMPGDVYKVNTIRPWIMIKRPTLGYDIPPTPPREGKQEFFFLRNQKVGIHGFTPVQSVCNGSFCDRQKSISTMEGEGCGCYAVDSRISGFVLAVHVKIVLPSLRTQMIRGFRSWRFTNLLFSSTPPSSGQSLEKLEAKIDDIREKGGEIVNYVNDNGGWDVVGWYKRGVQTDGSASASNNPPDVDQLVASDKLKVNITYLYPSNLGIKRNSEFKEKQFDVATLDL